MVRKKRGEGECEGEMTLAFTLRARHSRKPARCESKGGDARENTPVAGSS